MALINDIYIYVESEDVSREITASTHPVEEGIDLTDNVRRSPLSLELSGEIVGSNYEEDIEQIERLQKSGKLVEYVGINLVSDVIISKLSTSHSGEIRGGCRFTMELNEIRIASSPYSAGSGNGGQQQIEEAAVPLAAAPAARTHTVKSGDTLWGIAKSYYGNGAQFPTIFNANRDKLSDPNKIRPGQVLTVP